MNSHHKTELSEPVHYVGLDVSKARLDYVTETGTPASVPNTSVGHATLIARLREVPGARVVCEASGGYERALLAALWAAQLGACRVPPGRVRHYARAEGLWAKTDRIDAALLGRYARTLLSKTELAEADCGMMCLCRRAWRKTWLGGLRSKPGCCPIRGSVGDRAAAAAGWRGDAPARPTGRGS